MEPERRAAAFDFQSGSLKSGPDGHGSPEWPWKPAEGEGQTSPDLFYRARHLVLMGDTQACIENEVRKNDTTVTVWPRGQENNIIRADGETFEVRFVGKAAHGCVVEYRKVQDPP